MPQNKTSEAFVRQLTENQPRLYGYVYSLLGDHSRAADVVQETNLVLWRKIDEFDVGKPFLAWALGIARFQVLASLRDQKRDRLMLDAELAEQLSSEVAKQSEQFDDVRRSLRDCLQRLAPRGKELIELRYFRGLSTTEIATQLERSLSA
ncbi:MAG: sigma-70 family RNA polymerase sigma factor, partial [Planctomycetota bacterium]